MAEQKPIKLEEGNLKQFLSSDELPNQKEIEELKDLIGELVKELIELGLPIYNEKLLKLCH